MLHQFKPCADECGRCRQCLSQLDCVPHLPIAPSPTWPDTSLSLRNYTTTENLVREASQSLADASALAVSRAAR